MADTRISIIPPGETEFTYAGILVDSDPPDDCPHKFEHGVANALKKEEDSDG